MTIISLCTTFPVSSNKECEEPPPVHSLFSYSLNLKMSQLLGLSVCVFPVLFSLCSLNVLLPSSEVFCSTETSISLHISFFSSPSYICIKSFWELSHKNVFILIYFGRMSRSTIILKSISDLLPLFHWI